jgi:hypothetical protein
MDSFTGHNQPLRKPRMNRPGARLRNELVVIIALKICVLTMLWFAFVRGAHVPDDAAAVARHLAAPPQVQGFPQQESHNGH